MHENFEPAETMRVEIDETQTDAIPSDSASHSIQTPEISPQELADNYHAIIKSRVIYYPVPYRLVRELGRGRQGVVFLGLRHGARGCITRHALKLFDPAIYPSSKKYWTDMGRIAEQTSLLQFMSSPNLVRREIYDETNGIGYTQMDLVEGVDLKVFLSGVHLPEVSQKSTKQEFARFMDVIFRKDGGRLSVQPGIALYILRQMLRGIEALHDVGFLHSDVKPANVMVDRAGYVKIVDFGRALKINERVSFLLGSPMYMAPEIHRREPGQRQSDLFSVGLVGLELLRGEPLVNAGKISERELLKLKLGIRDNIHDYLPAHVRENELLVDIFQQLLSPKIEERYSDARKAESDETGLRKVHKQLTLMGKDSDYGRELSAYLSKIVPPMQSTDEMRVQY